MHPTEMPYPLWSRRDHLRLAVLLAAGAGVIVWSWLVTSGRGEPADQLPFVSIALVGLLVELHAVSSWLSVARRAATGYRRLLLGSAPIASVEVPTSDVLVARPAGTWCHRADCLLARGRDWEVASAAAHRAANRRPCPACRPDRDWGAAA